LKDQDVNNNKEHTVHARIDEVSKPMNHKYFYDDNDL